MRPIKFRAWDDYNKKMVYDVITLEQRDGYIAENITKPVTCSLTEFMQFTGLHDKKGKEIWEGDWVKFQEKILEIKWGGHWGYSGFGLHGMRKEKEVWETEYVWDCLNPRYAKDCEVIGNLYELLEDK